MGKELSVGVAQKVVLDLLGVTAHSWGHAERIFAQHGIVVASSRQGRASVPKVREASVDQGGWTPGLEDGYSAGPSALRLTPAQREALAPYWFELR